MNYGSLISSDCIIEIYSRQVFNFQFGDFTHPRKQLLRCLLSRPGKRRAANRPAKDNSLHLVDYSLI